jgi:hypothetical protein
LFLFLLCFCFCFCFCLGEDANFQRNVLYCRNGDEDQSNPLMNYFAFYWFLSYVQCSMVTAFFS